MDLAYVLLERLLSERETAAIVEEMSNFASSGAEYTPPVYCSYDDTVDAVDAVDVDCSPKPRYGSPPPRRPPAPRSGPRPYTDADYARDLRRIAERLQRRMDAHLVAHAVDSAA